ncbi:hypothetical protein MMC09_000548 [Bachmanniomyces sp. S44760]|nr:hypothetical protein [Bachmanniomyces sp. S44760]
MAVNFQARAVSPLLYEDVKPANDDVLSPGSDDDCTPEERAWKRRRIEELGQQYLQGKPLFILSAGLRGPLEHGWSNPWASASYKRQERKTFRSMIPSRKSGRGFKVEEQRSPVNHFTIDLTKEDAPHTNFETSSDEPQLSLPSRVAPHNSVEKTSRSKAYRTTDRMKGYVSGEDDGHRVGGLTSRGASHIDRDRGSVDQEGWLKSDAKYLKSVSRLRSRDSTPTPTPKPTRTKQKLPPHETGRAGFSETSPITGKRRSQQCESNVEITNNGTAVDPTISEPSHASKVLHGAKLHGIMQDRDRASVHQGVTEAMHATRVIQDQELKNQPRSKPGGYDANEVVTSVSDDNDLQRADLRLQRSKERSGSPHAIPASTNLQSFEYFTARKKPSPLPMRRASFAGEVQRLQDRAKKKLAAKRLSFDTSGQVRLHSRSSSQLSLESPGKGNPASKSAAPRASGEDSQIYYSPVESRHRDSDDNVAVSLLHGTDDAISLSNGLQEAQVIAQQPGQNVSGPSGPSTDLLETDHQSIVNRSTDKELDVTFSTQAALAKAQRSFQFDLLSPIKPSSPETARKPSEVLRNGTNVNHGKAAVTPFRTLEDPRHKDRNEERAVKVPLSTQEMVDAMTPFAISTIKKVIPKKRTSFAPSPTEARSRAAREDHKNGNRFKTGHHSEPQASPLEFFTKPSLDMETSPETSPPIAKHQPPPTKPNPQSHQPRAATAPPPPPPPPLKPTPSTSSHFSTTTIPSNPTTSSSLSNSYFQDGQNPVLPLVAPPSGSGSGIGSGSGSVSGNWDIEAALEEAGSFLGTWDVEREAGRVASV